MRSECNSHSTMYLLKLGDASSFINIIRYSHSTMYLLKPSPPPLLMRTIIPFTFHHVSIKTPSCPSIHRLHNDSHSTMYLLKLKISNTCLIKNLFTFHHVSIKTKFIAFPFLSYSIFTFHHVSIKTTYITRFRAMLNIHIPPCIY